MERSPSDAPARRTAVSGCTAPRMSCSNSSTPVKFTLVVDVLTFSRLRWLSPQAHGTAPATQTSSASVRLSTSKAPLSTTWSSLTSSPSSPETARKRTGTRPRPSTSAAFGRRISTTSPCSRLQPMRRSSPAHHASVLFRPSITPVPPSHSGPSAALWFRGPRGLGGDWASRSQACTPVSSACIRCACHPNRPSA